MLDPNYVFENFDLILNNCQRRQININSVGVENFPKIYQERKKIIQQIENLRNTRNSLSKKTNHSENDIIEARKIKTEIQNLEQKLKNIEKKYYEILSWIPNVASKDTPIGKNSEDNVEYKAWSEQAGILSKQAINKAGKVQFLMPAFPKFLNQLSEARDHVEIGKILNIIDLEQSAKVSGTRFSYLRGALVLMQNALHQLMIERLLSENFIPMIPPLLVKDKALFGSSHFPGDKDQVYAIKNDNIEDNNQLYLVGSAEPSLFSYFQDKIIDQTQLPFKAFALTTCFRSEVGSWGKDVRGLKRVHQFDKLEMNAVVLPEKSNEMMEYFLSINEWLLQSLKIPYRVLSMCTGDLGYYAASKKYDVEAWLPSQQEFMELMSDTNTTDYQARRLNIKVKLENGSKIIPHTVNDTGIAMGRMLIAIIDNYQKSDGSVEIPKVLHKYMFGIKEIKRE